MKFPSLLCVLLAMLSFSTSARGEFLFNIVPSQSLYISDGVTPVTGYFDVVLNLTGSNLTNPPTNVRSYNFQFTAPAALGITEVESFGTGLGGGLLNGTVFDLTNYPNATNIFYAKDSPTSVTAFQGANLARFHFTTSAVTSTYSIVPGALGQLADSNGDPLGPLTVNGGSINISAVPEPSTMVLVGLVAVGGGAVRFVRRRRAVC